MPVNLRDFMNAMNEWIRDAPPGAREVLPASMWMKVRQSSTDVDGGVYFDPRTIVDAALDGRKRRRSPSRSIRASPPGRPSPVRGAAAWS